MHRSIQSNDLYYHTKQIPLYLLQQFLILCYISFKKRERVRTIAPKKVSLTTSQQNRQIKTNSVFFLFRRNAKFLIFVLMVYNVVYWKTKQESGKLNELNMIPHWHLVQQRWWWNIKLQTWLDQLSNWIIIEKFPFSFQ